MQVCGHQSGFRVGYYQAFGKKGVQQQGNASPMVSASAEVQTSMVLSIEATPNGGILVWFFHRLGPLRCPTPSIRGPHSMQQPSNKHSPFVASHLFRNPDIIDVLVLSSSAGQQKSLPRPFAPPTASHGPGLSHSRCCGKYRCPSKAWVPTPIETL